MLRFGGLGPVWPPGSYCELGHGYGRRLRLTWDTPDSSAGVHPMNKLILALVIGAFLYGGLTKTVSADASVAVVFTSEEVRIIASWYDERGYRMDAPGAGKGKSKCLPPGIAKNLAGGKALPPGIAKRRLPDELVRILPPPPRGFERVIVDGRVLLVEVATQVIHDVLTDLIVK